MDQFFTNDFFTEEERPIIPIDEALARNFPSNSVPLLLIRSYLPSYIEWSSLYSVYSPHRVAFQFGYDQGAPLLSHFTREKPTNFSFACANYLTLAVVSLCVSYPSNFVVPSKEDRGKRSALYINVFWQNQLVRFQSNILKEPLYPEVERFPPTELGLRNCTTFSSIFPLSTATTTVPSELPPVAPVD